MKVKFLIVTYNPQCQIKTLALVHFSDCLAIKIILLSLLIIPILNSEIFAQTQKKMKLVWRTKSNGGYPVVVGDYVIPYKVSEYYINGKTGEKIYYADKSIPENILPEKYIFFSQGLPNIKVNNLSSGGNIYTKAVGYTSPADTRPYLFSDSIVYGINNTKTLQAVNVFNDSVLWKHKVTSTIYNKFEVNNRYVIYGDRNYLYKLYRVKGKVEDSLKFGGIISNIIVENNKLYTVSRKTGLNCIDLSSNEVIWKVPDISFSTEIQMKGDTIFCADYSFFAIDKNTGKLFWKYTNQNRPVEEDFFIFKDKILVNADAGNYGVIDKKTGNLLCEGIYIDEFYPEYNDITAEYEEYDPSDTSNMLFANKTIDGKIICSIHEYIFAFEIVEE